MAFIYILYLFLIILIFAVVFLIVDYYQVRKKLMENPRKLQLELNEKIKIQEKQQAKLSILWKTQKTMEERVLQIDQYLKHLKEIPAETENDLQTVKIMEMNTQFTMNQINKSLNFIQEMEIQQNK